LLTAVLSLAAFTAAGYYVVDWWLHRYIGSRYAALDVLPSALVFAPGVSEGLPWIDPLDEPVWRPAGEAEHMRGDDPVVGISIGDRSWAIPWWILKNHHVANLELAGRPVLITFCEICSSGAAFVPLLDDERLRFRLAGAYNGTILTVDDQTGSFWSPFTGRALHGPLEGRELERLPMFLSHWDEWVRIHPQTRVAHGAESLREGHVHDARPGSAGLGPLFKGTLTRELDERLAHNELVLGVATGGAAKAYPLGRLNEDNIPLNDRVGGEEIVVFHLSQSFIAIAFSRSFDEQTLTFERTANGRFSDLETQSVWNHAGKAIAGPLSGRQLSFASSGVEEWYVWAAYHPQTEILATPVRLSSAE
jgi:hypothetical protein